jgi:hypothetical protein
MGTNKPSAQSSEGQSPDIVGLRPDVVGVYVSFRCRGCAHLFERYQPTVAGIVIGLHTCPKCQAACEVSPELFEDALERFMPNLGVEEMIQQNEEASHITEQWYRIAPLAKLLTYRGINLGEPTERYLLSFITLGLNSTQPGSEEQP